ncbi:hypothetical protein [Agarivorans sp.]|uniref:hypothetical protein n=1 Tax=Agarivorans sp. TaxID=1872412 RepID=UPI003D048405
MQITSSSNSTYQTSSFSKVVTESISKPSLGDVVDKIKEEYQQLTPEQQRNAQLYLNAEVSHYQQKQQAETSAKRNLVLGVSATHHQQKLLDAYYTGLSGKQDNRQKNSQALSYNTLEGINDNLQQQKRVDQKLALAQLYLKYGESTADSKPEPHQGINLEA